MGRPPQLTSLQKGGQPRRREGAHFRGRDEWPLLLGDVMQVTHARRDLFLQTADP
jgi:hypothetical protein